MPTIIEPSADAIRETEVSESQLRALRSQVESDRRGTLSVRQDEPKTTQRLWDAVEGAWTSPLPLSTAQFMLREVVFKCSACNYTSVHEGQVKSHVSQVREVGAQHRRARLKLITVGREGRETCSGCGTAFTLRKMHGKRHLERCHSEAAAHQGAIEEVVMHRYAFREGADGTLGTREAAEAVDGKR